MDLSTTPARGHTGRDFRPELLHQSGVAGPLAPQAHHDGLDLVRLLDMLCQFRADALDQIVEHPPV